jgi:CheY-like chemotaxis protein
VQPAGGGSSAQFVKRTILLVDGDPAVQRTIKALFARDGHDVEVAGDPQHALDLAERGGFDLVITDARAMAPGKRGVLLAEELVARLPALRERIIVATGDVRPSTEETLTRLGVATCASLSNLRDLRVTRACRPPRCRKPPPASRASTSRPPLVSARPRAAAARCSTAGDPAPKTKSDRPR